MLKFTMEDGTEKELDIELIENLTEVRVQVHGGKMHADDIMAVAILKMCMQDKPVHILNSTDENWNVRLDCGNAVAIYEDKVVLDHHQRTGYCVDQYGKKMSACNLAWEVFKYHYFSRHIDMSDLEMTSIMTQMQMLLGEIAALDNGEVPEGLIFRNSQLNTLFSYFNVDPLAPADVRMRSFENAVQVASILLTQLVLYTRRTAQMLTQAMDEVKSVADTDSKIIRMSAVLPWLQVLKSHPDWFIGKFLVTYPSPRDGKMQYYVQAVPVDADTPFSQRVSAPKAWRGLRDHELQKVSGVKDALFCHATGFLCTAASIEGAEELAKKIIDSDESA